MPPRAMRRFFYRIEEATDGPAIVWMIPALGNARQMHDVIILLAKAGLRMSTWYQARDPVGDDWVGLGVHAGDYIFTLGRDPWASRPWRAEISRASRNMLRNFLAGCIIIQQAGGDFRVVYLGSMRDLPGQTLQIVPE